LRKSRLFRRGWYLPQWQLITIAPFQSPLHDQFLDLKHGNLGIVPPRLVDPQDRPCGAFSSSHDQPMMNGSVRGGSRSRHYLVVIAHDYLASALDESEPRFVREVLRETQGQQLLTNRCRQYRRRAVRDVSLVIEPPPAAIVHNIDRMALG